MRSATRLTRPLPGTVSDPRYPEWMKKPMGDTDFQSIAMTQLRDTLDDVFINDPRVYVAMNIVFYYLQGSPRSRRDPDVLVARGVSGKHPRLYYRAWDEGVLPCTLFEISSKSTWREDIGPKRRLYARINIPEYFVFDPQNRFLDPPLRGFRTVNGRSIEMTPAADGSLVSTQLNLRFIAEGSMLRVHDLRTGRKVLTRRERIDAKQEELKAQLQLLAERDAEIERLRAELARRGKRK
jgi:Uma2 family endonuclease